MKNLRKHSFAKRCANRTLPQIAMASDHYLMFRCPEMCDQNASIEFVSLEDTGKGEGVLTFNLRCPKCKKKRHYKISFAPYNSQSYYALNWTEQIKYWQEEFAPKKETKN